MNIYIPILIVIGFLPQNAWSSAFTIRFPDGAEIRIHKVEETNDVLAAWKQESQPLKQMFFTYNFPASLDSYKSIFYQGEYPSDIESIYPEWRPKMERITIKPQAIFYGLLDGLEVACIQYYFSEASDQIQMSFLAKRIEGKWYPVGSKLMAKYQHVMAFFATLQAPLAACLIKPDPKSSSNEAAQELLAACSGSMQTLTETCVYSLAESWGMSLNIADVAKEKQLFKNRINRVMPDAQQREVEKATVDYIQNLQITEEGKKRAQYYFSKNETMKAIWVLRAYGLTTDNANLFADLNRIQQTSQYRTFTVKPEGQSKGN